MKKIVFCIMFLAIAFISIGQENTGYDEYELQNFSILSDVQSSIDDAKGWSLQDNGKWAYGTNLIPFTDSRTNTTRSAQVNELGLDNFISLELRKLMIDDKQYNILVKKYRDGEYEFPFLGAGWKSYNSLDFWVFKSEKLFEMLPEEVPYNIMYLVNMECFYCGSIKNYDRIPNSAKTFTNYATGVIEVVPAVKTDGYVDDLIVRRIEEVKTGKVLNDGNMLFAVYPIKSDDGEAVRFKIIKTYKHDNLVKIQSSPDGWKKLFDYNFFEVPFSSYESFIDGSKEFYVDTEVANEYSSHYNWGMLRYQIGDYLGAIDSFTKAIKENPNTTDYLIYSQRGIAYSKSGKYSEAITDFTKSLSMKPTNVMDYSDWVKNYFNRGVAYYNNNNTSSACKDWRQAYDLGYGSASTYLNSYCGE